MKLLSLRRLRPIDPAHTASPTPTTNPSVGGQRRGRAWGRARLGAAAGTSAAPGDAGAAVVIAQEKALRMLITAGPMTTTNSDGNTQNTIGINILTGAF
jgi:hypothetical protein